MIKQSEIHALSHTIGRDGFTVEGDNIRLTTEGICRVYDLIREDELHGGKHINPDDVDVLFLGESWFVMR